MLEVLFPGRLTKTSDVRAKFVECVPNNLLFEIARVFTYLDATRFKQSHQRVIGLDHFMGSKREYWRKDSLASG
jgi:hypothetical protein